MEIYAFGSIVRGDFDLYSDIDILLLKDNTEDLSYINNEKYSVYTYSRIIDIWEEGNPFAWHLFLESKCIYCKERESFIQKLGSPEKYSNVQKDLEKFYHLFLDAVHSIKISQDSLDFDLSMIFLAIRNFASCFALGHLNKYEFSRDSALKINEYSIDIRMEIYKMLQRCRLLSTRGIGMYITTTEFNEIQLELKKIDTWFKKLLWTNF